MSHFALIMAGGEGTRFYPLSTPEKPKQFLNLYGDASLLQHTYRRIRSVFEDERILVATNRRYLPFVREQLPGIPEGNLVGESAKKNTAPCIAFAAKVIESIDPDGVMAVFPADHYIATDDLFRSTLRKAIRWAEKEKGLVTLGISPDWPSTEYGYIKCGQSFDGADRLFAVERFVEKPPKEQARQYCREGGYFWNSGIFVWPIPTILQEIERYLPNLHRELDSLSFTKGVFSQQEVDRFFTNAEPISIDYGVLERSKNTVVLPAEFRWSDLGSFYALKRIADRGEITLGAEILAKASLFESEGERED